MSINCKRISTLLFMFATLGPLGQAQDISKLPVIQPGTPGIVLPPNTPPGAYDSLAYSTLIRNAACPGMNKDCYYPATPNSGFVQWSCNEGNFCVGPGETTACKPGFYCPVNASQPIWCPKGFYCSEDTKNIYICPKNKYCPEGTVKPLGCNLLAYCPEGTASAPKFGVLILLLLLILIPIFLFRWKAASDKVRYLKHKFEIESLNARSTMVLSEAPKLAKLDKTFDIHFTDLGLCLPNGVAIMKGVTGQLLSGRTTAIMGPSGAGKTTFVTLLTGKVKRTSGSVTINGNPDELSRYKKLVGYVPQEDIMLRELSVREILMHSARMRLPAKWKFSRIKTKVLEIISFLGMSHVMDSIVGNEEERGISGGQRKRVNIGMELVAEPSVLFLDEPTSGLDSSTSYEVCSNLKQIAQQQGLTVAAVIHSPSPATFKQFDDFLLLGKGGQVVYMGPRDQAVMYFTSIGFPCPQDESPSDYFMDVVSGKVKNIYNPNFKMTDLFEYWEATVKGQPLFSDMKARDPNMPPQFPPPRLASNDKKGKTSAWFGSFFLALKDGFRNLLDWLAELAQDYGAFLIRLFRGLFCIPDPVRDTCPMYLQIWLLTKRAFRQMFRDASTIIFDLLLHFGCGTFISVATQNFTYLGNFPTEICVSQARDLQWMCYTPVDKIKEAGMFVSLGVLFAGISAGSSTFGREKVVFWRDTAAGMSTIPYYLAKIIVDIPRILLAGVVYSVALTLFYPLRGSFAKTVVLVELLYFSAFAMGYFLSIVFAPGKTALIGTGFALLWALVLSGVIPTLDDVYSDSLLSSLSFLWDLSPPRWAIEAFWIQEVGATPFANVSETPRNKYNWNNYNKDLQQIVLLTVMWNLISFFSLKLCNRSKQK